MTYVRSAVDRMQGYVYGEQPGAKDTIKLNTNENPYPPSPLVAEALKNFETEQLRYYPDPHCLTFCRLAADLYQLSEQQIIATNGGDELLRLAIATFIQPGASLGTTDPSYSLYPVLAAIQEAHFIELAYPDPGDPLSNLAKQLNAKQVQLFCLVNPHAPSGQLLSTHELGLLANHFNGVLLIDEAYVDFVHSRHGYNSIRLVKENDNVIILRTLSKGYSLAGLRFGYGMGSAQLIQPMITKVKDSYNVDAIAQALACAAMKDQAYAKKNWGLIQGQRRQLTRELRARKWTVPDSETNFVLARCPDSLGFSAQSVFLALKGMGILVRHFDQPGLADCLRITVGTKEQNQLLLEALDEIAE